VISGRKFCEETNKEWRELFHELRRIGDGGRHSDVTARISAVRDVQCSYMLDIQ
jgi:hypothetical protein